MPRVDVDEREREAGGPECLLGQPHQDDGILAAGKQQDRPFELRGNLAHDVNRFGFELLEMALTI
jgi:hypothetical protein